MNEEVTRQEFSGNYPDFTSSQSAPDNGSGSKEDSDMLTSERESTTVSMVDRSVTPNAMDFSTLSSKTTVIYGPEDELNGQNSVVQMGNPAASIQTSTANYSIPTGLTAHGRIPCDETVSEVSSYWIDDSTSRSFRILNVWDDGDNNLWAWILHESDPEPVWKLVSTEHLKIAVREFLYEQMQRFLQV